MNPSLPARLGAPKTVLRRGATTALIALSLAALAAPAGALADGPGVGTPTVVSVGDSYISGEGGRWAGNTNGSSSNTDALGSTAYYDNASNSGETIERCHRSKAAEITIGGGINSKNLACSGAKTSTRTDSGSYFKPGLDFYNGSAGQGQALMLQNYAAIEQREDGQPLDRRQRLQLRLDRPDLRDRLAHLPVLVAGLLQRRLVGDGNFTSANITARTTAIKNAILNIKTAMTNAGYSTSQYAIVVQDYMSPIPTSARHPLRRVRLHAPEHRRLRLLERRRQLGQQLGAADDQQRRQERRRPDRPDAT